MSSVLLPSTQVSITVSLQISTDREAELLTVLFLLLTPVLVLWQVKRKVKRLWDELILLVADIKDLLIFIGKVVAITFNAFAFGLGLRR